MTNDEAVRLEALKLAIAVATDVPSTRSSDHAIVRRTQVYINLIRGKDGSLEDSLKNLFGSEE